MRRIYCFFVFTFLALVLSGQAPAKFSYQAVIRDGENNLVVNEMVGMKISILRDSPEGVTVFSDTIYPAANENGLITIKVGDDSTFESIDWSNGPYFIKTETDPAGGTNYTITGVSQLLSVPYALYAEESGTPGTEGPPGPEGPPGESGTSLWQDGDEVVTTSADVGIGIHQPSAVLHTFGQGAGGGNVLFEGVHLSSDHGDPPASGPGTRMFWYPNKAAFRAGRVIGHVWDKDSIGSHSYAMGYNAMASGFGSVSLGYGPRAMEPQAFAMGYFSKASGFSSFAMGYMTKTTASRAFAMGYKSEARVIGAFAMGQETIASGNYAVAMGNATHAAGGYSVAMGDSSLAMGHHSIAAGYHASATQTGSIALGYKAISQGAYAVALGNHATASGNSAFAVGYSNEATGVSSLAMGSFSKASGPRSTVIGVSSKAMGSYSIALGRTANAYQDYSFAINLDDDAGPFVMANQFQISGATSIGGNLPWTNYSDRRMKKDIHLLSPGGNLQKIMQLQGVRFHWKKHDKNTYLGFIAQDVLDIIPECVRYDAFNDIYSMEYTALIPVLVEAMKEQQLQIEAQNQRILELTESLENLEKSK